MICLALAGYPALASADIVVDHPRTVLGCLTRYDAEAKPGLPDRFRSGRPRFGSPRLGLRLATCLAHPTAWAVPRLRRHLRLTPWLSTVGGRVREGAWWRRPRLIARGDPDATRRWAAVRRALRRLPMNVVIVAEDACHLDLMAWVRSTGIVQG